jgi:hypothetical protein
VRRSREIDRAVREVLQDALAVDAIEVARLQRTPTGKIHKPGLRDDLAKDDGLG